jgi:hypothetical protein
VAGIQAVGFMEKDNYARSDSTWMRFGSAPTECVAVRTTSFGSRLAFSAPLAVLAFNWLGPSPSDARGAGVYHKCSSFGCCNCTGSVDDIQTFHYYSTP